MYVDQVQGGNTSRGRSSIEGQEFAHYKFEKKPLQTLETVLFDIVHNLARRNNMQIALRKGKHNRWGEVKEKAQKTASVYERIALLYGMRANAGDEYYREAPRTN